MSGNLLNHKAAIEMLVADADQVDFDLFTFQNLHAVLSQNLMHGEDACGHLLRRPVDISGTVFYPLAMPQQRNTSPKGLPWMTSA